MPENKVDYWESGVNEDEPGFLSEALGYAQEDYKTGRESASLQAGKNLMSIKEESDIAKSLENVQNQFENVEIGSYPFFRLGKIGGSIVNRSTEKNQIDGCYKKIISFLKKKEIHIIDR